MALKLAVLVAVMGTAVSVGAAALLWRFGYYVAPHAWTAEPQRLAAALVLGSGRAVADVGAGDGSMAVAMAAVVGDAGVVYATELSADRRRAIAQRVAAAGVGNVRVITAGALDPELPEACCDGVYLRSVFHHVTHREAFAAALARTVRPGGRIAVIDFAPGTLWFHGADHGVTPDAVEAAFRRAGWIVRERDDDWGGGMFLRVFVAGAE